MSQIVKQVFKQGNGSDNPSITVPIGTDGDLVDMQSILNLEEELKIGGNKYTRISTQGIDPNTYTLTEQYYSSVPIAAITSATTATITHTVLSLIKNISETDYIYPIEVEQVQHQTLGTGSDTIVSVNTFLSDSDKQIMINYYQGFSILEESSTAYHQKLIGIKHPSSGGNG